MQFDNFLAGLKRQEHHHYSKSSSNNTRDIFFMLTCKQDGSTWVKTVDNKMHSVDADYRDMNGEEATMMRNMERIRERDLFRVEWGAESADAEGINISNNPQLLYQLVRCNNLVSADGKPINVSHENTHAVIKLHSREDGKKIVLKPELSLACYDIETQNNDKNSNKISTPQFLSDCFALVNHTIYPINAIGDNYTQLKFFLTPIDSSMVQEYLSVLFSYLDNIEVKYEDYAIVQQETEIRPRPTLFFEKVDADHTLYLRLVQQLKGLPLEFIQRFDINTVATLTDDHRINVRRVANNRLSDCANTLRQLIVKYAPNREVAKQVYYDDDFLFIIPEAVAAPFLLSALPQLLKDYQLIGADKLRDYKMRPIMPKLHLKLSSGIDFLEGEANVELAGEQFTLAQVLAQYSKKHYVELSDGNRAIVDDGYMRKLERIFSRKKSKDGSIKVSFFDLPEIENLLNHQLEGEAFRHHREGYEGFNSLAKQT